MSIAEKLVEIAQDLPKVYDAGFAAGQNAGGGGYAEGYEAGKQAEQSAFWDMYQQNGTRTYYLRAFQLVFTDEMFKPKYDIIPDNANQMFIEAPITNLKQLLESAGVILDTSKSRYTTQMFQYSTVTHVPTIDFSSSSVVSAVFSDTPNLVYIEKLIVKEAHTFPNAFARANSLVEIRVEGIIAADLDIHWSPLSKASIESIVSCLSDSASGKTVTFNKAAVLAAFGTEEAWTSYIASKPNWTFTLV